MYRILLTGLISAPTIRQYYSYVTDPQCKVSLMIVSLNVTDMDSIGVTGFGSRKANMAKKITIFCLEVLDVLSRDTSWSFKFLHGGLKRRVTVFILFLTLQRLGTQCWVFFVLVFR
jgi:hypothetical protein